MLAFTLVLAMSAARPAVSPAPAASVAATPAVVQEPKVGDVAPDFSLTGADGKTFRLSDYEGKKNVVLVFYPKAFTGGWTRELSAYRDEASRFGERDAQVVGISMDDAKTAESFRKSLEAPFPFLGDPDGKVVSAYGVSGGAYAKRVTFVVGKDGKVTHVEHDKLTATDALDACPMRKK